MNLEDISRQDLADFAVGVVARWENKPFDGTVTPAWQRGWRETDKELSGEDFARNENNTGKR